MLEGVSLVNLSTNVPEFIQQTKEHAAALAAGLPIRNDLRPPAKATAATVQARTVAVRGLLPLTPRSLDFECHVFKGFVKTHVLLFSLQDVVLSLC